MKILHLSWEYPPRTVGGISRHVYHLTKALSRRGIDVKVVTLGFPGAGEREIVSGVEVIRVDAYRQAMPDFVSWVHAFNVWMIEEALKFDVDLIHAHDWLVADAAIALKHMKRIPLLATIHSTEHGRRMGIHSELQLHIHEVEWTLCYEAWRIVVCSRYMKEEVARVFGIPDDKVRIIPNGIEVMDGVKPDGDKERYAPDGERLVLYVGRMVYEKGVHLLLEAARRILEKRGDVRFVLVGDGPIRERLAWMAKSMGIRDNVVFTGFVSDDELTTLYRIADLVVVPSLYEPFGIVALEAMSMEKPVVVSDVGGLGEIVEYGTNGLKFPPGDPDALADRISMLIEDRELAERIAKGAKELVMSKYSWDSIAERTLEVYDEVMAEYRSSGWRPR